MPYTPTSWVAGTTPLSQANMSNLDGPQYTEATLSHGPDVFTAGFVLSGYTAVKDGSINNQLDVAAGTAYLLQADGTTRQRKLNSSTQTTVTISATYHLYLQPDGTWYWSTSNTPAANSLHICDVTTDVSGNISTVTDARVLNATLLPNMAGILSLGGPLTLPFIVAQVPTAGVHVTVTTLTTILAYTPTVTGLYRLSATFDLGGSGLKTVLYQYTWTSPNLGGTQSRTFQTEGTALATVSLGGGNTYQCGTDLIPAKAGSPITISYQNSTATPADFVYALIERVA